MPRIIDIIDLREPTLTRVFLAQSSYSHLDRMDHLDWTHKAERKKAAMRKAARARILGKRAAAAARQARGGAAAGKGGAGRGGKARVFRRAKRDCLVMDARRKKLGAYLFCGMAHTCMMLFLPAGAGAGEAQQSVLYIKLVGILSALCRKVWCSCR